MKLIKVIFTIIAILIGAGFASGQEINTFFYSYGLNGLFGLIFCSFLLTCVIYIVLRKSFENDIFKYNDFVHFLFSKYGFIINTIVNFFLLTTFFIMIAGFGAYFSQEVKISPYIGSAFLAVLCFFTFMNNIESILKISSFLVIILIIFIIIISFINISTINYSIVTTKLFQNARSGWLLDSLLYCSYNSILLIPILISLKNNIHKNKDIITISVLSGLIVLVLSISIFLLLTKIDTNINKLEMPIIYVISHFYKSFKKIYAFIILSSIYTTAISVGIGFLENIVKNKKHYKYIVLFMCITGFLISGLGFTNLVTKLYPFFGYLGLVQIALLFCR